MFNTFSETHCPKCNWQPRAKHYWKCHRCGHKWNIFDTYGKCPKCKHNHSQVDCQNCEQSSAFNEWFATWRNVESESCDLYY